MGEIYVEAELKKCNGEMPSAFSEIISVDESKTSGKPVFRMVMVKKCDDLDNHNICLIAKIPGTRCWARPDLASRIDEDMVDSPEDKEYMDDLNDD